MRNTERNVVLGVDFLEPRRLLADTPLSVDTSTPPGFEVIDSNSGSIMLGAMAGEIRQASGRIDIPATIAALEELGANTFYYLIWENAHDWDDLPVFATAAARDGISVWAYVIPWSETPPRKKDSWGYSEPFRTDYIRWAQEVARLSLEHPNIAGLVIDDFWTNTASAKEFSPRYVGDMVSAGKRVNPRFAFYPLMYFQTPWEQFVQNYGESIDGVALAYPKSEDGINNALTYLRGQPHGSSVLFSLERNDGAMNGESSCVETTVDFVNPTAARLSFYCDSTNDPVGNTAVIFSRVYLNHQKVWEMPLDSGAPDGFVTVDLSPYLAQSGAAELELGVFTTRSGTPRTRRVEHRFDDIRIFGTSTDEGVFSTGEPWRVWREGDFRTTLTPASLGRRGVDLPVVLMPAGVGWQYRKRYNEPSTIENMQSKLDISCKFIKEGLVQGIAPWRTPLVPEDPLFDLLKSATSDIAGISLCESKLVIHGKAGLDIVRMSIENSRLKAEINGTIRTCDAAEVSRVEIYALGGNDKIDFAALSLPVYADGGRGNDAILGGSGLDTLVGGVGKDTVRGGDGDDTILGGAGPDCLDGGGGADLLVGNGGNDCLRGMGGADRLYGRAGKDLLDGGPGNDRIYGGLGDDSLCGGSGNDELYCGGGADSLIGNKGDDMLSAADSAADLLDGGSGSDSRLMDGAMDDVTSIEQLVA